METIIAFLLVLSLLIFVHELGHYLVAKLSGIRVERFSIGMPPRLVGIKIGETDYCISAIPIGGYVALAGQSDFDTEEDDDEIGPDDYRGKPVLVRMAVLVAGSFMNLLTAVVIFSLLFWSYGVQDEGNRVGYVEPGSVAAQEGLATGDRILTVNGDDVTAIDRDLITLYTDDSTTMTVENPAGDVRTITVSRKLAQDETFGLMPYAEAVIGQLEEGSQAAQAGLESGDHILAVGGTDLTGGWYQMSMIVQRHPDEDVVFKVQRGSQVLDIPVHLGESDLEQPDGTTRKIGHAGIMLHVVTRKVGFFESIAKGYGEAKFIAVHTLDFFAKLVTGRMSAQMLGGPVLIAQMAGEQARMGIASLMSFTAFISINLGVLNLLPFPVLDGGHIFILAIETVSRRKLSYRLRMGIQQVGSIVLILFMIYVTFNDLMRIDTISRLFGG